MLIHMTQNKCIGIFYFRYGLIFFKLVVVVFNNTLTHYKKI